jgi:DNA-binding XRE family transcriptional regulator
MPAAKTKTTATKPPRRSKAAALTRHDPRRSDLAHATITHEDGTTYVLVPEDEYVELVKAEMAADAVAVLEDPHTKWVDFDEYRLQLAGSKIAEARKARKLTQAQLAKKLGVPQSQISRIERHPDQTTIRTLKRIAKALRVDVSLLVE